MSLANAMNNMTQTENGAASFKSTLDANLDLFFKAGASRGKNIDSLVQAAVDTNEDVAVRTLLWMRDVRGGAGERKLFRDALVNLRKMGKHTILRKLVKVIPELGRWDDMLVLVEHATPAVQDAAIGAIQNALESGDGLCAKWMPRKGAMANRLRKAFGYTPKQYRKTLVGLTNVVETAMCQGDWSKIEYDKVPSLAQSRYSRAFSKHDPDGYETFLGAVEKGEAKINAGALYPYDLVKSVRYGNARSVDAQWNALPNYMEESEDRILPVVDVSGSMGCSAGGQGEITCMDVAISLGLYISERNEGIFKNQVLTFHSDPKLFTVTGDTLAKRIEAVRCMGWGMNTDLDKTFRAILDSAVRHNLSEEDMPTKVLILSDMQFDDCTGHSRWGGSVPKATPTLFEAIRQRYEDAGYKMPQLVFWNINSRAGDVPVTMHQTGTALVSGFSPAIMGSLLGEDLSPMKVMLDTVMKDRYNWK